MSYGSAHTAPNPTVSVTLGPTYATLVNAVLDEFRTTLDAKVTPAGLDINANLSMLSGGVRYGLIDTGYVKFYTQPSLLSAVTYPGSLQVGPSGELYYNDTSGNQAVLTAAGFVAGTAGSITGAGYGAAGVAVNWDAGNTRYQMKSGSGTDDYAHVALNDVLFNDGSGNFLRMSAPALAADYTLPLPNAAPAASSLLQFNGAGASSFVTSLVLAANANVTLSGTGTLTSGTGGVVAGAGGNVTVSSGGEFKHGSRVLHVWAGAGFGTAGAATFVTDEWVAAGATDAVLIPISLTTGDRITAVAFTGNDANAGNFWEGTVYEMDEAAGTSSSLGSVQSGGGTGRVTVSVTGLTTTVATTKKHYVGWVAGTAGDTISGIQVTYDRP